MPYEATVPVHRRLLWPAVTDVERLIGALPNASIDASGAQGVAGRLRVRTRDQTVTFRGVARIVEVVPSSLRVSLDVEAVFGRVGGTVEGVVEIALRQAGSGTRVLVDGRLEINPGASALSAEALDAAFSRVVRRWFAALAETSPAKASAADKSAAAERSEQADEFGRHSVGEQSSGEQPRRRTAERAPLAVVRDLSADEDEAHAQPANDEDSGNAEIAQYADSHAQSQSPQSQPTRAQTPETQTPQPQAPQPQAPSQVTPLQASNSPNGRPELAPRESDREDADAESSGAEPPVPAPLRLVTPQPQVADEVPDPQAAEPENTPAQSIDQDAREVSEPEPEDIWSRLRDRSVPPWIPFLVGVATASLAGIAVVLGALRRRYRR